MEDIGGKNKLVFEKSLNEFVRLFGGIMFLFVFTKNSYFKNASIEFRITPVIIYYKKS